MVQGGKALNSADIWNANILFQWPNAHGISIKKNTKDVWEPQKEKLSAVAVRRKHRCIRQNMTLLVILLLASGCVTLCSCSDCTYHLINEAKTWDEAQSYCRSKHTDLATIADQDDMKTLVIVTGASGVTQEIWIGLRETGPASWLWSVGETGVNQGLAEYANWDTDPDNSDSSCGGMRADGKWLSVNCATSLPFVCQEAVGSTKTYIHSNGMTWREAQNACRLNKTDLATVRNQAENQALQPLINGAGSSLVWIGLFKDEWRWSDRSNSSFRYWATSQPNNDGSCTLYNPTQKTWYDRGCTTKHPFYCYDEKKRKEQIVRVVIKSDTLNDFDDLAVHEAIMNQLQKNLEGVKLRWKVQPNGKIFQKQKKKEDNEASGSDVK